MATFHPASPAELELVQTVLERERRRMHPPSKPARRLREIIDGLSDGLAVEVAYEHDDPFTTAALKIGDEIVLGPAKRITYAKNADGADPEIGEAVALKRAAHRFART